MADKVKEDRENFRTTKTLKTIKRGYRRAVFVVVYRRNKLNRRVEYLILKRKKHWIGWEFSKGGIEFGERDIAAARRECFEESGLRALKIKQFNVHGKYRYHKIFKDRPGFVGQSYKLFCAEVSFGRTKIDNKEHSAFLWRPFNLALKKLKFNNQKKCLAIVNNFLIKRI